MRRLALLLFPLVASFAASGSGAAQEDDATLRRLLADEWEFRLRESPLFATRLGDRRYNDRLPEVGEAAERRRLEARRAFLSRLEEIDRDALRQGARTDYDLFRRQLEEAIAEAEHRAYLMPFTTFVPFYSDLPELPDRVPLATVEDYRNYVARLEGIGPLMEDYIRLMREGLRSGITIPRVVLGGVVAELSAHVVDDPEESLLYAPFADFPAGVPEAERSALRERGRRAIASSVVPGYRAFRTFMAEEYIPGAREEIGASSLPGGADFYAHRVRRFTTLDVTPEEVHRRGLEEIARIRTEMETIIDSVAFEGGLQEFLAFLRTDPRFYAESADELLARSALAAKRMDGELPRLFGRLPRTPYGIRPIPDFMAPTMTTAYYSEPSADGSRGGVYFVNTWDLKSRPLYEVEALTFHEAVPGHHLQIALGQELGEVPDFRRFTDFTAFVEGWALYAEGLGHEVGFYQDPYSAFGGLVYSAWRAARLVVDTGIHAFGWTRRQAIDYMAQNTGLALHNIEAEVDRYISWPGQALAYKMGELAIRDLRARAEAALGEAFDLRGFHDVVLGSGAVPLPVLEANVEAWIAGSE